MNDFYKLRPLPIPLIEQQEKCHCGEPLPIVKEYEFSKGKNYLVAWHYASMYCKKHQKDEQDKNVLKPARSAAFH